MNSLSTKVLRVVATLTAVATILSLSGFAMVAPQVANAAVKPSDFGLKEGDTISAAGSSDPDVYIVNDYGYKRLFLNPAIFNMYGHLGGFAKVKTVTAATRDAFVTSGLFRVDGSQKVYGVEVNGEDTAILHWVNTTGAQAVADDPNFFKKVFVINQTEFNWYTKGSDYTSVNQIPVYTRGTNVPASGLSASLAYDNPASTSVIPGSAAADLAHFSVNGSGSVTKVVVKRIGVSKDADLDNVYLYVGNKRVSDSAAVSSGIMTFANVSGLFTAPANVSVRADINASTAAGSTIGVQITQVNDTAVSASGNLMNVAAATLATVAMNATTLPNSDQAPTAGSTNLSVWSNQMNVGTRSVNLKYIALKMIGSAPVDAIQNLGLYVDGLKIASGTIGSDSMLNFDLTSSPVELKTGSRTLEVRGDVIKGSNLSYSFSLQNKADFIVADSQYGANVSATNIPASSTSSTISKGTVSTVSDPSFTATNFVTGVTNVTLGRWVLKGYGENVKISQLTVTPTVASESYLDNVALYIDGGQAASSKNYTGSALTFDLGSSLIVPAGGQKVVEVRADTTKSGVAIDSNSIKMNLKGVVNQAQGLSSGALVGAGAGAELAYPAIAGVDSQTLTATASGLTKVVTPSFVAHTEVPNQTKVKVGSWTIQAANAEAVRVSNVKLTFTADTGDTNLNNFSNLYITDNTTPVSPQAAGNNFAVNFTLQPNQTHVIDAYMDVGNTSGTTHLNSTIDVTANGVQTGSSVGFTSFAGVEIQFATSTLATWTKTSASPTAQFVVAGKSGQALVTFNIAMTSGIGSATITDMHFKVAGTATAPINNIMVGGKSAPIISAAASVSGLAIAVPGGYSGADIPVSVDWGTIGVGGANTSNTTASISLDYIKYTVGTTPKTLAVVAGVDSSLMTLVGTKPSLTVVSTATRTGLTNGTIKLADFKVTADTAGDIILEKLPLTVSSTGVASIASASVTVKDENGATVTVTNEAIGGDATLDVNAGKSASVNVVFGTGTTGYRIPAGQSKTFSFYTTASTVSGAVNTTSLSTTFGAAASFAWKDVNGNVPDITGSSIYNYPTDTSTISN